MNLSDTQSQKSLNDQFQVQVSSQMEDKDWDSFLAEIPGGHHVQTSLWAQVKAFLGYRPLRVVISERSGSIVSGAQILIRSFPMMGRVGFVSKGPVIGLNEPLLEKFTVEKLLDSIKVNRIQYLIVQPPNNGSALVGRLVEQQLRPVNIELGPTATILIDLHQDLDTILAEMKPRTRYNIRLGERKGMKVRQGAELDVSCFYELLKATSRRQNFSIYSLGYYERLWHLFSPGGLAQLFIVEFEGEVVSARLTISFGDHVINKLSVWSGKHGKFRPNEVLNWATIQWAKAKGYHYFDQEGINLDEMQETEQEGVPAKPVENSVTSFKLGFGGQVTLFPGAYLFITNPIFRPAYQWIYPKIADTRLLRKTISYIRTS